MDATSRVDLALIKSPFWCYVASAGFLTKIYINAGVMMALLAGWAAWKQFAPTLPPQISPLNAPLMKQLPEFDEAYKASMLWGSYRAGHYFGMRTR